VQNFAKYLGHRVTVTGSLTGQGDQSVMKVRNIRNLANSCTAGRNAKSSIESPAAPSAKSAPPKVASGCLDEEPGPKYVLRSDRELGVLAELEPDGFSVQNFARYLGHKVQLEGESHVIDGRTIMKVRNIK